MNLPHLVLFQHLERPNLGSRTTTPRSQVVFLYFCKVGRVRGIEDKDRLRVGRGNRFVCFVGRRLEVERLDNLDFDRVDHDSLRREQEGKSKEEETADLTTIQKRVSSFESDQGDEIVRP